VAHHKKKVAGLRENLAKWNYLTHSSLPRIWDIVFNRWYNPSIVYWSANRQHQRPGAGSQGITGMCACHDCRYPSELFRRFWRRLVTSVR